VEPNINPAVVHPQVSHIGHLVDDGAMVSHRAHTFKYKSLNSHWHYHDEDDAIEPNP
jgi:hypothetical protein